MTAAKAKSFTLALVICLMWLEINLACADDKPAVVVEDHTDKPDIALLEFLGNTAGLESLGVNLDQLLASAGKPESTRKREDESDD